MNISAVFPLIAFACACSSVWAGEPVVSPDKRLETYTIPNNSNGTGMKLFLRPAGGVGQGILLCQNDRWIAAKWSPDSRFLAVENHHDGHISDITIYRVTTDPAGPGVMHAVHYQSPSPNTYDTKWEVVDWGPKRATATLLRTTLKAKVRFTVPLE